MIERARAIAAHGACGELGTRPTPPNDGGQSRRRVDQVTTGITHRGVSIPFIIVPSPPSSSALVRGQATLR